MKSQIDVVLVHPGNSRRIYQGLANEMSAIEPPVWASLMAEFLRRAGHVPLVLDAEAEHLEATQVVARLIELNPRLVTLVVYGHQPSASTQNMTECALIAKTLKSVQPSIPIIMVGGHVASLPERTLREEKTDFVATGEGLYTMADLLSAFKGGQLEVDLPKVRGLGYRLGTQVQFGPPAPLVTDLDVQMPALAWDLLQMPRYRAHNWHCFGEPTRSPYASLYTSLGCPFHCSFCCIQAPFREGEKSSGTRQGVNSYRNWSTATVLAQLDVLVQQYGVRHIKFADEMFVMQRDHVLSICDGIIERGYDLNIWAYARVDTVKPDMLDKLRRAGFRWLAFGIESGSQRVRKAVGKGISQERVLQTLQAVRSAGIYTIGNFIFGLPEDDLESMRETLDLALELKCEFANFYCAMAYPGSPLYDEAVRNQWRLPQDWSGYSQHSTDSLPLPTRYLTGSQVLTFRDDAFQRYYDDPGYLNHLERTFGSLALDDLRKMTGYKLERLHAAR